MNKFAEYKKANYNGVTKDGHTMFIEDIVKDLNRKSFLEAEVIMLREALQVLTDELTKGIDRQ